MRRYLFAIVILFSPFVIYLASCNSQDQQTKVSTDNVETIPYVDTLAIPKDSLGNMIRYGRDLMLHTAYYIGPDGINGKYLGNKMNCTNCHQEAGTKPYAFNLIKSHQDYPQYRAREGKVLSLAERVNNCVMRPHNGKPLPLNSREMIAFLSYFKWINSFAEKKEYKGEKPYKVSFPTTSADPGHGKMLYIQNCQRCHGANGEGLMEDNGICFKYPPLWGANSYQPGSSMHRVIKQAQWIKVNMPNDLATYAKPILTDNEAFDLAAFINDDKIHDRPHPPSLDYPRPAEKAIDYGEPPFADTFPAAMHKFGPYQPIINYWKEKGMKPSY
jgi:thiosulfate dehydrogenase